MQNYWILNSTKSLKSTSIKAWNSGSIPHCPEASSCSKPVIESLEQNIAYGWTIYQSSSVHTSPSILHTPLWTLFNGPWNIFDPTVESELQDLQKTIENPEVQTQISSLPLFQPSLHKRIHGSRRETSTSNNYNPDPRHDLLIVQLKLPIFQSWFTDNTENSTKNPRNSPRATRIPDLTPRSPPIDSRIPRAPSSKVWNTARKVSHRKVMN